MQCNLKTLVVDVLCRRCGCEFTRGGGVANMKSISKTNYEVSVMEIFGSMLTSGRYFVLITTKLGLLRQGMPGNFMLVLKKLDIYERRRVCLVQFARWRYRGEVCRIRLHIVSVT